MHLLGKIKPVKLSIALLANRMSQPTSANEFIATTSDDRRGGALRQIYLGAAFFGGAFCPPFDFSFCPITATTMVRMTTIIQVGSASTPWRNGG